MSPVRVLVVEDHPMFRRGLVDVLSSVTRLEVVGDAGSAEEALPLVAERAPDVVVMDLHLPGESGIAFTARLRVHHPQVAVLALTMLQDDLTIHDAIRAGARGYLPKEAEPDAIVRAIEAVAAGQAVFGGTAASRALAALVEAPRAPLPLPQLTDREREVLDLLARGLTNPAIAEHFHLSEKTVRNHVSNVFTKLGVSDRAAAVARARDAGLGAAGGRPARSPGADPHGA